MKYKFSNISMRSLNLNTHTTGIGQKPNLYILRSEERILKMRRANGDKYFLQFGSMILEYTQRYHAHRYRCYFFTDADALVNDEFQELFTFVCISGSNQFQFLFLSVFFSFTFLILVIPTNMMHVSRRPNFSINFE